MRCFSCGAAVPDVQGPTHDYMLSSPGCWRVYGEVLAREYETPSLMARHRLTVDAYAVQHPGIPGRKSTRSVILHLASLCFALERDAAPSAATGFLRRLADRDDRLAWLEPPEDLGTVTVADVRRASRPEEHLVTVDLWARSAWEAWHPHHPGIREIVAANLGP